VKEKVRFWFLLLMLLAACFLSFVTYRFSHEELIVDRCLSDYHGSFDYSKMTCDLATNHPYVSYESRHPRDKWNFTLAFICFVSSLTSYFYMRTDRK
jgi:hypothetical protein